MIMDPWIGRHGWGEVEGDPAALLRPSGDDVLKVWAVSKQVNSPKNNGTRLRASRRRRKPMRLTGDDRLSVP